MANIQCSFKSSKKWECFGTLAVLNSFSFKDQSIILTEAGILASEITQKFMICSEPYKIFTNQNRSRAKSKLCAIPDIISSHNKENKIYGGCCGVKADWVVSMEKVLEILTKTGFVVSIGSRNYTFLLVTIVINMVYFYPFCCQFIELWIESNELVKVPMFHKMYRLLM